MPDRSVVLNVNGRAYTVTCAPFDTLLDVLRDDLGLTGTKRGCEKGACGACTVLVDGDPVLACLTLAARCGDRIIQTIEGLAAGRDLHPLQQAAIDHGAVQCGYCPPGWLLTAKALLDRNPSPTIEEIRVAISGNLCRCTGYQKIEESILDAASRVREVTVSTR